MEARVILKKPPFLMPNASPNWIENPMATLFCMVQNFTQCPEADTTWAPRERQAVAALCSSPQLRTAWEM